MKCKTCKNKMENTNSEIEFILNNKNIKAINVPSLKCNKCDKIVIPDLIKEKLHGYACQYYDNNIIDYQKCSKKEEEDYIVLNMMGLI